MGIKRVKLTERQLKEKTGSQKIAKAKSKKTMAEALARMDGKNKKKKRKFPMSQKDFKRIIEKKSKGPSMESLYGDMLDPSKPAPSRDGKKPKGKLM